MQGSYPEGQCEILTFINLHIFIIGKRQIPRPATQKLGRDSGQNLKSWSSYSWPTWKSCSEVHLKATIFYTPAQEMNHQGCLSSVWKHLKFPRPSLEQHCRFRLRIGHPCLGCWPEGDEGESNSLGFLPPVFKDHKSTGHKFTCSLR